MTTIPEIQREHQVFPIKLIRKIKLTHKFILPCLIASINTFTALNIFTFSFSYTIKHRKISLWTYSWSTFIHGKKEWELYCWEITTVQYILTTILTTNFFCCDVSFLVFEQWKGTLKLHELIFLFRDKIKINNSMVLYLWKYSNGVGLLSGFNRIWRRESFGFE